MLEEAGHPRWLAELLARRGVDDAGSAAAFLEPRLEHLHSPRLLAGLDEAVDRLVAARRAGRKVAVVGDYDVDGVSGTALLDAVFSACGLESIAVLPHRMREGYGFQPVHVERAVEEGCSLVVTVDCGTRSVDAAEAAVEAGLEVIVTDHHLPGPELPGEVILVNPRQPGCDYPFDELSGAGLAFKLALAFSEAVGKEIDPRRLLLVACLGTIADLVPLCGENRVIASLGLKELETTRSVGLRALIDVARVRRPFTSDDVGYRLGPRLNAPGRLESADASLELLLSRDPVRARKLAADLDARNRERREWERQVAREAREVVLSRAELPPFLVAWSEDWHRGVVGIAAGRLAKELNRPTLLLSVEGETATGSGRSIRGIHLYDFLDGFRDRLARFGGHAQAVGLSVATSELEDLRRDIQSAAGRWQEVVQVKTYRYEIDFEAAEVGEHVLHEMQRLEPFGMGNRRPLTRIRGPLRRLGSPRFFGQGHLSLRAAGPDRARIDLLGWGWADRSEVFDEPFEALGFLEHDRYRGVVLRLVDVRPFRPSSTSSP